MKVPGITIPDVPEAGKIDGDEMLLVMENTELRLKTIDMAKGLFGFPNFAPRLLASLAASSTAACTSGVVTVTATSHGIPAATFDGSEFYFPGSASLAAGWYASLYRASADAVTFQAPGVSNFTSESVNAGASFTSEVTYLSAVLPSELLDIGKILSCRIHRSCDAVAAAHVVQMKIDTSVIGRYSATGASPNGTFTLSCAVATSSILSGVGAHEGNTAATVYNVPFSPSVENTISITGSLAAAGMYQRIAAAKLRIE